MYPNATLDSARRLEIRRGRQLLDLEVAHQRLADRLLLRAVLLQAGEQAVGREHGQAGVGERAEQHQDVAVLALAAHLLGVHARRLVAMVAVGDQQLGRRRAPSTRPPTAAGSEIRQSVLRVPSWSVAVAKGSPAASCSSVPRTARRGP